MAASSLDPLITRIREVLTDGAGVARTLAAADRFSERTYWNRPDDHQALSSRQKKAAYVSLTSATLHNAGNSAGSSVLYDIEILVELSYYTGSKFKPSDVELAIRTAASDMHKVNAALSYQGNLLQTAAAAATGLASAGLKMIDWETEQPDPETKLLRATMRLSAIVDVTYPS
jgi:hypothetical protein